MKIVYVEWIDAASTKGWNSKESVKGTMPIRSVGFLVESTKGVITLSTSQSEDTDFMDPLSIPRSTITKYKILKTVGV